MQVTPTSYRQTPDAIMGRQRVLKCLLGHFPAPFPSDVPLLPHGLALTFLLLEGVETPENKGIAAAGTWSL